MFWRKAGKWFLFLLMIVVIAGGAGGYWFLTNKERLLEEKVRETLATKFDGWLLDFETVHFDWSSQLTLTNVTLDLQDQQTPFVRVPEMIVSIDAERFRETKAIDVTRIEAIRPEAFISRSGDGVWNWQTLPKLPASEAPAPRWDLQDAVVHLSYQHAPASKSLPLTLRLEKFHLIPSGFRQFITEGKLTVDHAGAMEISGTYDLDQKSWTVEGQMNDIVANDAFLDLASQATPEIQRTITELRTQEISEPTRTADNSSERFAIDPATGQLRPASSSSTAAPRKNGLGGRLGVRFRVAKFAPDAALQYKFLVQVRDGHFDNPILPFPLEHVSGDVYIDNRQVICNEVVASNGATRIACDGRIARQGATLPGKFRLSVEELLLDERIRSRLTPGLLKQYDTLQPTGRVNLKGELVFDGTGSWTTNDVEMTVNDARIVHQLFPYPVHSVRGTVTQTGKELVCNVSGIAGQTPVSVSGRVIDPGPNAECHFTIKSDPLPIDEQLLTALPVAAQPGVRDLNAAGFVAGTVQIDRVPPPPDPRRMESAVRIPWSIALGLQVTGGSLTHTAFPYRISQLSGRIGWTNATGRWDFTNLSGVHDTAAITGSGHFTLLPGLPAVLHLALDAENVTLDRDLKFALGPEVRETWDELGVSGLAKLSTTIDWQSQQTVRVALPKWTLANGTLNSSAFPYALSGVSASGSYQPGKVTVASFTGTHGETSISTACTHEQLPDDSWKLRFTNLRAENILLDADLNRAIPESLQDAWSGVGLSGKPVSLSGVLELRGARIAGQPVAAGFTGPGRAMPPEEQTTMTAAWDLQLVLAGNQLSTGVDLSAVFGVVTAKGTWDGERIMTTGAIDLDSIFAFDHQFTQVKGPFSVVDRQVIVGSRKILTPQPQGVAEFVPIEERISAKAIEGAITLDAFAVLDEKPAYRVKVTLNNGQLQQYAMRYAPKMQNLSGTLNGWLDLSGRGSDKSTISGRGQLQVSPAAIYELPVILQIMRQFTSLATDRVAFRYAFVDFAIANQQVGFNVIDLVGDTISLRGRGWVRFDKQLNLDFYSMMGRNQLGVPLLGPLVNELSRGWVGVQVRGRTDAPNARIRAVPELDNAMRGFLGTFNPARNGLPQLRLPF